MVGQYRKENKNSKRKNSGVAKYRLLTRVRFRGWAKYDSPTPSRNQGHSFLAFKSLMSGKSASEAQVK
jgi:hypothetical protein